VHHDPTCLSICDACHGEHRYLFRMKYVECFLGRDNDLFSHSNKVRRELTWSCSISPPGLLPRQQPVSDPSSNWIRAHSQIPCSTFLLAIASLVAFLYIAIPLSRSSRQPSPASAANTTISSRKRASWHLLVCSLLPSTSSLISVHLPERT